jgi:hypothetical protein
VAGVIGWAQACGHQTVRRWVGQKEGPAIALYERSGFGFTGIGRSLEDRPSIVIREMQRAL